MPVMSSSMMTSDISTNSRSRIFLTTIGGRVAAELNRPWRHLSGGAGVGRCSTQRGLAAFGSSSSEEREVDCWSHDGDTCREGSGKACWAGMPFDCVACRPVG